MTTELEVTDFLWGIVRAIQPDLVIETGAYKGTSTLRMAEAVHANGHGHVHAIEVAPDLALEASRVVAGLPATIHQLDALEFTPPGEVDFVFFDSRHTQRGAEFRRFYPWMTRSTVVAFHDTAKIPGVQTQVDALEQAGYVRSINLPTLRGISVAQVSKP